MQFLSLFTGIGGLDLGLERAGWSCLGMCEQDEFCRAVLSSHWPGVPIWEDVRELTADSATGLDAIVGGFPCQDISTAGKGAGIEGERSGLWREFHRLVRDARPRWVVAENVPALRNRGADRVLGDLEGCGYTCTPLVVGARHVGAPHRRDRVFIVAYRDVAHVDGVGFQRERRPSGLGERDTHGRDATRCDVGYAVEFDGGPRPGEIPEGQPELQGSSGTVADALGQRRKTEGSGGSQGAIGDASGNELADAGCLGGERRGEPGSVGHETGARQSSGEQRERDGRADRDGRAAFPPSRNDYAGWRSVLESDADLAPATPVEPQICRVADGLSDQVGRRWRRHALRALGNAVVVDVAEMIGRAISAADDAKSLSAERDSRLGKGSR